MSKTRQKTHSETEHFRALIRQLQSENKQLKRRLRQIEKKEHFYDGLANEILASPEAELDFEKCENCKSGILAVLDFGKIKIKKCDNCGFRKKI